jgi:hypothetical protein
LLDQSGEIAVDALGGNWQKAVVCATELASPPHIYFSNALNPVRP